MARTEDGGRAGAASGRSALECDPGRDVEWRRSPRARRVSLRVDTLTGRVIVTLPQRVSQRAGRAAGMALLADNAGWIAARRAALPERLRFEPGGEVPLGGVPHPIRHAERGRGGAWVEDGVLFVSGEAEFLGRRVADFLRAEARHRFTAQAAAMARGAGLALRRVSVKDTRTRWGSCSAGGALMFCWRLVMAPPFVQEYVVAHEVAHLRHMDHGREFWAMVDRLTPGRARAIAWLHEEGPRLLRAG